VILQAGADVNLTNPYGLTALMVAVDCGLADIVRFLLEAGADPNISDGVTMTLLSFHVFILLQGLIACTLLYSCISDSCVTR
jgi:ankyrin repeat protein